MVTREAQDVSGIRKAEYQGQQGVEMQLAAVLFTVLWYLCMKAIKDWALREPVIKRCSNEAWTTVLFLTITSQMSPKTQKHQEKLQLIFTA